MSQISIIKKSDIQEARRFDAECFVSLDKFRKKYFLGNNEIVLSDKHYVEIIDGDRGSNYPNGDDFSKKEHCLFLNTSNVLKDGFDLSSCQYITKEKDEILGSGKLKRNDIVFTTRGTIGNIGIYNEDIKHKNIRINSGMIIFRLKNILPEYFFTLLLSDYMKLQIKAYSSGSVQKQIPIHTINQIKIPILPQSFQLQIGKIVKSAYKKQTQSKQLYKQAEEMLLKELDLLDYAPEHILSFQTTKKETDEARRFDAEYFQPKYEEIIKRIENYKNGWDFVKNIVNWKKGVEVGSEAYRQDGMSFGRVADCSINGVADTGKKISKELYQELKNDYQPKQDDILFTKDGTIGLSYVVKEEFDLILSGAFLRLSLKDKYKFFEKECLSLIFNSLISKMQVEKLSGGAIIAHLKPSDFEKFKIPLIKPQIQKQIAKKITESHKLRKESKELLEEAKRRVEEEIEREAGK